ncbi:MAG: DUF2959 family protein [Chitinophagales bacterium]|nr:DUF2959 family protein [Bacteroidota bacterium]
MKSKFIWLSLAILFVFNACRYKGPEDLPKYKKRFKAQIEGFEKQKNQTDEKVEESVSRLSTIQEALESAKNVDKEFKQVYSDWDKVNKEVEDLNKEYENLKSDAENLFTAMKKQTEGLRDAKTRQELTTAITKTQSEYEITLGKTERAINSLRTLHEEALDIVKALEVAIALGQIAQINTGLENIESRVSVIMSELNNTIVESKDLYNKRIQAF